MSKLLKKYEIGRVRKQSPERSNNVYTQSLKYIDVRDDDKFYHKLKMRVEKYFRENRKDPREHPTMYLKSCFILLIHAISVYYTFYANSSFAIAAVSSLFVGFAFCQIGVSIQHDANHGSYSTNPAIGAIMGVTLDLIGISSFNWKQQHVVGHHPHTNVINADPDIAVMEPFDPRRYVKEHKRYNIHRFQHFYMLFLYTLMGFKLALYEDFVAYFTRRQGHMKFNTSMNVLEHIVFWIGKVVFVSYMIVFPILLRQQSVFQILTLNYLSISFAGFLLAIMFQVSHVQTKLDFFVPKNGVIERSWAVSQIRSTSDYAHGSWLWLHLTGGLNYQVVHHLFPGMCHCHYPDIAPLVQKTCDDFGIKYHIYPNFFSALRDHLSHLKRMGANEIMVPISIG